MLCVFLRAMLVNISRLILSKPIHSKDFSYLQSIVLRDLFNFGTKSRDLFAMFLLLVAA